MAWVVTAVTAAFEIGTVAAIATAVAEVGIAMTVVGTVTKSKELLSVGKVLSVAGGVTAIGANLANLATTGLSEGAAGAAAGVGESGAGNALADASGQALTNQAVDAGTNAVTDKVVGAGLADVAPNIAQNSSYGIDGLSGLGDVGASAAGGVADQTANQAIGGFAAPAPVTSEQAIQAAATPQFATTDHALTQSAGNALGSSDLSPLKISSLPANAAITPPGFGEQIGNWWDKQSQVTKSALIQGGLGALGGLSQAWQADQRLALERKIADEKMKTEQAQRTNANAIPTIRFQPVGLVNRAIGG